MVVVMVVAMEMLARILISKSTEAGPGPSLFPEYRMGNVTPPTPYGQVDLASAACSKFRPQVESNRPRMYTMLL